MARKSIKELTIPDSIYSLKPIGTIRGKDVYKDNPFIQPGNFCIQIRQDVALIASGLSITDNKDEEISAGVVGKIQMVDTEQFVKLYTKNIALIFELNSTAQKTLIAVFAAVQFSAKDKAEIFLTYNKAIEYYNILGFQKIPSQPAFSRGIQQLINMGFLAANYNGEGWYWFNPNLIFNGDRIRFVKEYRLKRKEEESLKGEPVRFAPAP